MKTNDYLQAGWMVLISVWMAGCSTTSPQMHVADDKQQEKAATVGPPPDGMARIIFKRHANMFGAIVTHFVVDRGEGIISNAVVFQKKTFPDRPGNFDKMGNVKQVYAKLDAQRARLMMGRPLPGDVSVTRPATATELAFLAVGLAHGLVLMPPESIRRFIENHHDYWLNSQSLVPNAQLAGVGGVHSGETVFWDRPPGTMKIEVITEGGDQAFSPAFKVEGGRTYFVDYHYMSADFKVSENK